VAVTVVAGAALEPLLVHPTQAAATNASIAAVHGASATLPRRRREGCVHSRPDRPRMDDHLQKDLAVPSPPIRPGITINEQESSFHARLSPIAADLTLLALALNAQAGRVLTVGGSGEQLGLSNEPSHPVRLSPDGLPVAWTGGFVMAGSGATAGRAG
jgi:hypothetical protein